jgi:transcriptional regulator with XRE-family HTH domain
MSVYNVWIKEGRHTSKLSQEELANRLGISQSLVSMWERGDRDPDSDQLTQLENVLGKIPRHESITGRTGTARSRIVEVAKEILKGERAGIRFSDLASRIQERLPNESVNTVRTTTGTLVTLLPNDVYKPARGILRLIHFRDTETQEGAITASERTAEEQFYKPFAGWLTNDVEECTKAIHLGGNRFKDKWGTPDVIGKRESAPSDIVKSHPEVVSAEIKIDTTSLIVAFGQACSYRLFSHKVYIVVPNSANKEDIDRLDSLCMLFGIGFVLFDNSNPESPAFTVQVRAARHEPDMFYVNKYMKLIEDELWR